MSLTLLLSLAGCDESPTDSAQTTPVDYSASLQVDAYTLNQAYAPIAAASVELTGTMDCDDNPSWTVDSRHMGLAENLYGAAVFDLALTVDLPACELGQVEVHADCGDHSDTWEICHEA